MEILVRAGDMQGYEPLMRSLGHDPRPLLARCGLTSAMLANEDGRVPMQAAYDLMALSVAQTGLEDFGLRAAQHQDINMLGPLALALQNCPTVGVALHYLTRHLYVQSPATSMQVIAHSEHFTDAIDLRYDPTAGGQLRVVQQVYDHGIAVAHGVPRQLAAARYELLAVSLPHVPRASLTAHERYFGAPIRTERS